MNKLAITAVAMLSTVAFIVLHNAEAKSQNAEEISKRSITAVARKVLEQSAIPGTDEELRLMLVEFPPGYASVAHSHPVAGLCYVLEGKAISQYEGEEIKQFSAGQSYQDEANTVHRIFRNASTEEPLRFICAAKIKIGAAFMRPLSKAH